MTVQTRIVRVERGRNGLWRITDSEGVRYATKNAWLASLCDRYREQGVVVEIASSAGWYYRELQSIRPEGGEMSVA